MDIVPTSLPDLIAVAGPESRAPPQPFRPPTGEPDASAAILPFGFLLQQLADSPLPVGQPLPTAGNTLPASPGSVPEALMATGAMPVTDAAPPTGESSDAAPLLPPLLGLPAGSPPPGSGDAVRPADAAAPRAGRALDAALAGLGSPADADSVPAGADRAAPQSSPSPTARAEGPAAATHSDAAVQPLPQPQAANRVIAALMAASEPSASAAAPPAETLAAHADADDSTQTGAERRSFAATLDSQRGLAVARQDTFELPRQVAAGDVPAAMVKVVRGADAAQLAPMTIAPETSATAPVGHAPAASPNGGLASPATSAAHAPAQTAPHGGGAVDTTAARWHDAFASRVQWLVDHDIGEARIKLNPPELGALDVKISLQDDKTFVQLTAHNSAARDELAQSLPRLRELLSANGLELGGATVNGGRDHRPAPYAQPDFAIGGADLSAAPSTATPRLGRASASQIDVFA
jgi:flagellar hook-length control protein FliK